MLEVPHKRQERGAWRFYSDRFVFNRHSGEFYLLSHEGALAFSMALDGARTDEIAKALIETFGAEPTAALRDAEQFSARLRDLHLVRQNDSPEANKTVRREKS